MEPKVAAPAEPLEVAAEPAVVAHLNVAAGSVEPSVRLAVLPLELQVAVDFPPCVAAPVTPASGPAG